MRQAMFPRSDETTKYTKHAKAFCVVDEFRDQEWMSSLMNGLIMITISAVAGIPIRDFPSDGGGFGEDVGGERIVRL
jgi:hypothetical protein